MAIAWSTHGNAGGGTAGATYPVTLSVSVAAGDSLVIAIGTTTSQTLSVWDNAGNTYTALESGGVSGRYMYLYGMANAAYAVTTVTVSFGASASYAIAASVYSGVTGFSATNIKTTNGTSETLTETLSTMATGSWNVSGYAVANTAGTSLSSTANLRDHYNGAFAAAVVDSTTVSTEIDTGQASGNTTTGSACEMEGSSIAYLTGTTAHGTSITALYTLRVTASLPAGDALVIGTVDSSSGSASPVTSQGDTLTLVDTDSNVRLYTCIMSAHTSFVQLQSTGSFSGSLAFGAYSGVSGFTDSNKKTGTGTPAVSLTLPNGLATGSWTVAVVGYASAINETVSATTGSLRESIGSGSVTAGYGAGLADNTTTAVAFSNSASETGYGIAVEMTAYLAVRPRIIWI
jgi:hypothetical protein